MRQRTKDREDAIRNMTRLGIAPGDQAKLLRLGATLHRLAEAECNGDYPAEGPWIGRGPIGDCGTQHKDAQGIAARYRLRAVVNGDPRGMVLGLVPQDASREDVNSGRARVEYVR